MTEAAIGGPFFPPCSFSFFVCCSVVGKKSWFNTTAPTRRLSTLQLLNPSRRTCAASNFLLRETLEAPLLSLQSWSITDWAVAVCLKPPSPLNTKINRHNWVGEYILDEDGLVVIRLNQILPRRFCHLKDVIKYLRVASILPALVIGSGNTLKELSLKDSFLVLIFSNSQTKEAIISCWSLEICFVNQSICLMKIEKHIHQHLLLTISRLTLRDWEVKFLSSLLSRRRRSSLSAVRLSSRAVIAISTILAVRAKQGVFFSSISFIGHQNDWWGNNLDAQRGKALHPTKYS